MKVTKLGFIFALKNVFTFVLSLGFNEMIVDPTKFAFSLITFIGVNSLSDLFLLNHASKNLGKEDVKKDV